MGPAQGVFIGSLARAPEEREAWLDTVCADEPDLAALTDLSRIDPVQSRVVELRFFGGLTVPETAEVLHVSPGTVKREWSMARAWLHRELHSGHSENR